jgi:hypothetical protein
LEWVDEPDEIEQQVIEVCQGCGASLVEMPIVEWQCAQVHDLVPIEMRVKEHQVAVKHFRGYLSTLKKQGHPLLDALEQLFLEHPISLSLQPE